MSLDEKIPIHIAFGTDDKYSKYAGVSIASILLHSDGTEQFYFYILDNGISEENRSRFLELQKIRPHKLTFLKPDMNFLHGLPLPDLWPPSVYLRFLLPDLMPDLPRILYMDCDTLATVPLRDLWEIDLHGKALGVIEDFQEKIPSEESLAERLGLGFYFNSGILLMDLQQIREKGFFQKAVTWSRLNYDIVRFPDQDIMNVVFANDVLELAPCWNIQIYPGRSRNVTYLPQKKSIRDSKGILHFVTSQKPDRFFYFEPQKAIFENVLSKTPWSGELEKPTLIMRVKKLIKGNRFYQCYRRYRIRLKNWLKGKFRRD